MFIRFPHRFLPLAFETVLWNIPSNAGIAVTVDGSADSTYDGSTNVPASSAVNVCPGDVVRIVLYVSDHHFNFVHAISIVGNTSVPTVFYTQCFFSQYVAALCQPYFNDCDMVTRGLNSIDI